VLESDGIPAALLDAQVAGLGLGPAAGGVRLLVPPWDFERAQELLATPVPDGALELAASLAPTPSHVHALGPRAPRPGRAERRFAVARFLVWSALVLAGLAVLAGIG